MKIVHKETLRDYPEVRGETTSQLASLISTKSKAPFKKTKQKLSRNLRHNHRVLKIARKLGPAIEDALKEIQTALDEIRLKRQSKNNSRQLTSPLTTTETSVSLSQSLRSQAEETNGFYCDICGADDWHDCPHDDIPSTQNDQNLTQKDTELQLSKDYSDDLDICQTQKFDISTHKHPLTKIAIKRLPERVGKIISFDTDTDSE